MAWGNFCFIPGFKKWDENARSLMLGWLPTIGLVIGLVWALIYFLCVYASLPYLFVVFVLTFMPFILSGFIHVDGFMDCNDALLSRGTLEKKQAILKDSRCGTFAIITIVFTVLCYFACLGSAVSLGIDFVNLIILAVLPRSVAALEVLLSKPMEMSQYARMHEASMSGEAALKTAGEAYAVEASLEEEEGTEETLYSEENGEGVKAASETEVLEEKPATIKQGVVLLIIQLVIILLGCGLTCTYYLATGIVLLATVLGSLISATIAKKSLNGMNGDIAGYSIIWGELLGVIALSIV